MASTLFYIKSLQCFNTRRQIGLLINLPSRFSILSMLFKATFKYSSFFSLPTFSVTKHRSIISVFFIGTGIVILLVHFKETIKQKNKKEQIRVYVRLLGTNILILRKSHNSRHSLKTKNNIKKAHIFYQKSIKKICNARRLIKRCGETFLLSWN